MKLAQQLTDYINAAFTGLWIQSHEPDEAEREIIQQARQQNWKIAVWDIANGLRVPGIPASAPQEVGAGDPLAALRALPALADDKGTTLLLLHNFHRFFNNPEVIQTTFAQIVAGKQRRTFVVVLSPVVQIPVELEKLFVVIEHALPDRDQLERIARELLSEQPNDMPKGEHLQRVLDAAGGMTGYEAEGAFALSLAKHNQIQPEVLTDLKAGMLKKSNLLTLHRGTESFNDLGGLGNLKEFCRRALQPGKVVKPRGILLLGVPGTGKSAYAKALGNETGRPTLLPDVAEKEAIWSMYRSHYGIPDHQHKPDDTSWTGAEIKACCRLAALLDQPLSQAARNVVPVAVTAAESVEKLRTWASGRCLCANNPGIYTRDGVAPPKAARRITRPSEN